MTDFTLYAPDNAPGKSAGLLDDARKKMGFVANLYAMLAEADTALEAYFALSALVERTRFSPAEQQLILLAASAENDCRYCVAAHSSGARMAKLDKAVIAAVRDGAPIADARLEALRRFVEALVATRGRAGREMEAFLSAGFDKQQVLEVVMCVSMKTLANYANHLMDTPLDAALSRMAWPGRDAPQKDG